jgi:hypothetical protein
MTEREKLIELLDSADLGCIKAQCYNCDHYNSPWKAGKQPLCREYRVADHLIANGVTIQKLGRWIIHSNGHGANATNWAECSECHVCGSPQWKVCPVCESRMEQHSAINIEEVDFDYAAEDDNA